MTDRTTPTLPLVLQSVFTLDTAPPRTYLYTSLLLQSVFTLDTAPRQTDQGTAYLPPHVTPFAPQAARDIYDN